jgi:hypothetical protein
MKTQSVLLSAFFVVWFNHASAEELANIFGSEELQTLSREASAEAILAIELAMSALRARELGESAGIEELFAASSALAGAISNMRKLLDSGFVDFELSIEQRSFLESRIGQASERYEGIFTSIQTFSELFSAYLLLGERLVNSLEQAAQPQEGRSALSYFAVEISDFIAIGDALAVIGRSRFQ